MRTGATPGETVSDEAILDAVAAEAGWMEDLLVRLVEAPTTLGDEEAGQRIMEQAFADCGLEPRNVLPGRGSTAQRGGRLTVFVGCEGQAQHRRGLAGAR